MKYKKLFLLTLVLWLRKALIYLLVLVIIFGILLYFIANSPRVIKKAVDAFAPDYNITYSRIYGNALTGVKIDDIKFNKKLLAKNASVQWNPDDLLKNKIVINHINLDHVNVDTIKGLIGAFSSDSNERSSPFTFDVSIIETHITIAPFVEKSVLINNIDLTVKDIFYSNDEIAVKKLDLMIDSNITKVMLEASIEDRILKIGSLDIKNLDILAIEQLISNDNNENIPREESNTTVKDTPNALMPSVLRVQKLSVGILPMTYEPVDIQKLTFTIKEGIFDISTLLFTQADIELETEMNLAKAVYTGHIKNNQLIGILKVTTKEALLTQYNLPLNRESIGEIDIHLDASKDRVIASIDKNMTQVLKADKDAFNLDINSLISRITYMINDGTLKADTVAKVSTPYAKNIMLTNFFMMDENISYNGDIFIKQIIGVDAKFLKPINDLKIQYRGNEKSISNIIDSSMIEGKFVSNDFKTATLHLESKNTLVLRDYIELPAELNNTKANIVIDLPLDFENNVSYVATVKIQSNVANIDANVSYKETLHLSAMMDVPNDSLLRPYNDALKWDALMPVKTEADILENSIDIDIQAESFKVEAKYDLSTTEILGTATFGGLQAHISGISQKEIKIDSTITAIPLLMKNISNIYTLEGLPKIEGSGTVSLLVKELQQVRLSLTSPQVVYYSDHKTAMDISDIDVLVHYEEDKVVLEHYKATVENQKIYATKPSTIFMVDNLITLNPLWINDTLKAEGSYDLIAQKGKVIAKADKLHLTHEIIDLDSAMDISVQLDGNKTNMKGNVVLLGGDIHYDLAQKSFASDSDILIIQDIKDDKPSLFMENLSLELQVKTKKPLLYNKDAIDIKASVDLSIHKAEHAELLVLGTVEILKGGTYIFQDKSFVLEKSFVHFTGNPDKPLLEMKAIYKALNHTVTIGITGSIDLPQISFSSKPTLNKEQILSLILFDTETGAGTNSGDDMMKMMGGAMAKSALNNIGIKLDHLVLGEGNSVEVGKKLTDRITIIYVNDIVSEVKLKYKHGSHTESIIGASERSQSYDIVYKLDF